MIPALGMVILPQNPSTGDGQIPGCSCILSVGGSDVSVAVRSRSTATGCGSMCGGWSATKGSRGCEVRPPLISMVATYMIHMIEPPIEPILIHVFVIARLKRVGTKVSPCRHCTQCVLFR